MLKEVGEKRKKVKTESFNLFKILKQAELRYAVRKYRGVILKVEGVASGVLVIFCCFLICMLIIQV